MEDIPVIPSLRFPWKKVLAIGSSIAGGSIVSTGTIIGVTKNSEILTNKEEMQNKHNLDRGVALTQLRSQNMDAGRKEINDEINKCKKGGVRGESLQQSLTRLTNCQK